MAVHEIETILTRDRREVDEVLAESVELAQERKVHEVAVVLLEPNGQLHLKYTDTASPAMIGGLSIMQDLLLRTMMERGED